MVSGYRLMWVLVMFDLPVTTAEDKRNYTKFRKKLLGDGFWQIQFSVYMRPCRTDENADTHQTRVEKWLPPYGQVRIMLFTDKQFGRMKVFFSKRACMPEEPPEQLSFF